MLIKCERFRFGLLVLVCAEQQSSSVFTSIRDVGSFKCSRKQSQQISFGLEKTFSQLHENFVFHLAKLVSAAKPAQVSHGAVSGKSQQNVSKLMGLNNLGLRPLRHQVDNWCESHGDHPPRTNKFSKIYIFD